MKKIFSLLSILLLFICLPSTILAEDGMIKIISSQNIKVYYFENLKNLNIYDEDEKFNILTSEEQNNIKYKLQSYIYSHNIKPYDNLKPKNNELIYKTDKSGFYLFVFEKKEESDKIVASDIVLVKYTGDSFDMKIKPEKLDKKEFQELTVIMDWKDKILVEKVLLGLYDEDNNLIDKIWLSKENNWRYTFSDLNPLKYYSIWPQNLKNIKFKINRIGNVVYIKNTDEKYIEELPQLDGNFDKDLDKGTGIFYYNSEDNKTYDISVEKREENNTDNNYYKKDIEKDFEFDDKNNSGYINKKTVEEEKGDLNNKKEEKLPQTGLLWWPVPILIGIGLFIFILSFKGERNEDKNEDK
ncbi:hypothetical protein ABID14_000698 [Peptoniphilus olsenii]|uniref:EF-hand domain-containing protein n=1 Tax=Peptoniphilus olsenii TaxID=411570 RepID=A0ABV2J8F9_9FIRM